MTDIIVSATFVVDLEQIRSIWPDASSLKEALINEFNWLDCVDLKKMTIKNSREAVQRK